MQYPEKEQICHHPPTWYSDTTAADQDYWRQFMNSTSVSACLNTGVYGGNNTSFANENLPLQVADYEQDSKILLTAETVGSAFYTLLPSTVCRLHITQQAQQQIKVE